MLSQKDITPLLSQFEKSAYRTTCEIFVSPTHNLVTLDDDLYVTRASKKQVKLLVAEWQAERGTQRMRWLTHYSALL